MSNKTNDFEKSFYGVIENINQDMVYTRVYTKDTNEVIYFVTFKVDSFVSEDKDNIKNGLVFDWNYGQVNGISFSNLKIRKPIILTEEEKVKKEKEIKELFDYFFPKNSSGV